jgi:hypothetical protein
MRSYTTLAGEQWSDEAAAKHRNGCSLARGDLDDRTRGPVGTPAMHALKLCMLLLTAVVLFADASASVRVQQYTRKVRQPPRPCPARVD